MDKTENNKNVLADINNVRIDGKLSKTRRMESFRKQIINPYLYLDNGITVEVGYADTDVTLHERLLSIVIAQNGI